MTEYRHIERAKKRAQRQADHDGGTWCVVKFPDYIAVRPERRARNLLLKHPECELVATIGPVSDD